MQGVKRHHKSSNKSASLSPHPFKSPHAHHFRYQRPLRSSATSRNAPYTTNSARKASKLAVPLQAQALDPAHSLGSAASLAAEGQPLPLHHLAPLATQVVSHHQTL